jgi:hypothetical protein
MKTKKIINNKFLKVFSSIIKELKKNIIKNI